MPHQNSCKFECLVQSDAAAAQSTDATLSQVSGVQRMPIFSASTEQQPTSVQAVLSRQPIIFAQLDAVARNRPVPHELPGFPAALGK